MQWKYVGFFSIEIQSSLVRSKVGSITTSADVLLSNCLIILAPCSSLTDIRWKLFNPLRYLSRRSWGRADIPKLAAYAMFLFLSPRYPRNKLESPKQVGFHIFIMAAVAVNYICGVCWKAHFLSNKHHAVVLQLVAEIIISIQCDDQYRFIFHSKAPLTLVFKMLKEKSRILYFYKEIGNRI